MDVEVRTHNGPTVRFPDVKSHPTVAGDGSLHIYNSDDERVATFAPGVWIYWLDANLVSA